MDGKNKSNKRERPKPMWGDDHFPKPDDGDFNQMTTDVDGQEEQPKKKQKITEETGETDEPVEAADEGGRKRRRKKRRKSKRKTKRKTKRRRKSKKRRKTKRKTKRKRRRRKR